MATLLAITLCQHISDFHIFGEKLHACHHPLPAKPPSCHHFFQLLAPACVLEKNVMASNTSAGTLPKVSIPNASSESITHETNVPSNFGPYVKFWTSFIRRTLFHKNTTYRKRKKVKALEKW
jgi:hypothetical protein